MRTKSILHNCTQARWRSRGARHRSLIIGTMAAVGSVIAMVSPAGVANAARAHVTSHSTAVFTTLVARVPQFSGSAAVYAHVQAEPLNGTRGLAARPILVRPTRVSGSWLRLTVPASAATAALAKANHGVANLLLVLTNGTQISILSVPTRATGTTKATVSGSVWRPDSTRASTTKIIKMGKLLAIPAAAISQTPDIYGCYDSGPVGYDNNEGTRIGELHVASQTGVNGKYFYNTQADSTMTVGVGGTGNGWSVSGSTSVSNSIGAGGYTSHTDGWIRYVKDHMNYEKDKWLSGTNNSLCTYQIFAYSSNGDAFDGSNSPSGNPWGNCHSAPYYATINPGGGWDGLNSTAKTQDWSFSAFNAFEGSGHTGYETTNRISYHNGNSSNNTYVCGGGGGTGKLAGSPVIYNNPS